VKVRLLNAAGLLAEIPRERLFFGYRSFSAGEYSIVLGATIRVHKGDSETIKREIARIVLLRREKHPLEFRNAGSVFKNANGIVVGRLVEELGLKGTRIGDAQISPKHGNFIVNLGKASAKDVVALMELVKEKARRCEGIELEAEVKLMGF
jgi:UDP-N-acetylmuramate dehydrogenase